ncbi:MAG: hypothetical protein IJX87_05280 [Clostridia bacterium]|nr:hypothetical protein [Clostridia bacterium]
MRKTSKKILSVIAAATFLGAAFSIAGCSGETIKGNKLDGYESTQNAAVSNGGFAVEKDGFVYFINGAEDYTASNKYGEVVKGALLRIPTADLQKGDYSNVKTVVPSLFAAQNFESGIYIYGDYVYYATPTTDKNLGGTVENSWIDFKRAKLDGSEAMSGYYFRLSNNAANYRFVENAETKVVYCLYEEDSALKSYNTATGKTTVLVKGAKSSFYFDKTDLTNPNVYYTMSVVYDADTEHSTTASYDQLYCVDAFAEIEKVDASAASYTVKGGKTYDFDEKYLKSQEDTYDLKDYTTYPYVNLGELVLDGRGSEPETNKISVFNENTDTTPATPGGYTYTVTAYQNGGVYFTRAEVTKTSSDAESVKLYYLADADALADSWNVVSGNAALDVVAQNTTNASATAIYTVKEDGTHEYFYVSENTLYKANNKDGENNALAMAYNLSSPTLWTLEGDYLYYYAAGTNGNNVSRINYTGKADDYHNLLVEEEYQPVTVAFVDWNSSWYKPEMFGNKMMYSNAQTFGTLSYNYIYVAEVGAEATTETIVALNEAYEAVNEKIDEYSSNTALQTAMKYYFRTGKTDAFEAVKDLYTDYQVEEFEKFVADLGEDDEKMEWKEESAFISALGFVTEADTEEIEQAWVDSLLKEEVEEEDNSFPTWAIVLISVGAGLVVAAAIIVPIIVTENRKKAKKEADEETMNAYQRKKLDTTDDKSIDVYADEEAAEEKAEEAAEEATEVSEPETVEEVAAEVTEEVAEEAPAEAEEVAPVEEEPAAEEEKQD